jgi:hypothetical protein
VRSFERWEGKVKAVLSCKRIDANVVVMRVDPWISSGLDRKINAASSAHTYSRGTCSKPEIWVLSQLCLGS